MKNAIEWLNEVGETVASDCFSPESGAPGQKTELLIARIQADARAEFEHKADQTQAPPVDNAYVASGCEQFTSAQASETKRLEADAAEMREALDKIHTECFSHSSSMDSIVKIVSIAQQALATTAGCSLLERLERLQAALSEAIALCHVPEHSQDDEWNQRLTKCAEALKGGDK